jgi:hypothetical protein
LLPEKNLLPILGALANIQPVFVDTFVELAPAYQTLVVGVADK